MYECIAYMYMHLCPAMPVEVRRGGWIPWNWGYGWLLATMWVLEI